MTVLTLEQYKEKYQVEVHYNDEIEAFLRDFKSACIYLNDGTNSDSGLKTALPNEAYWKEHTVNREVLYEILAEARVHKSEAEIDALRWASIIGCEAHIDVLRKAKAGMSEYQIEAIFLNYGKYNYLCGRVYPYNSICGCGPGAATLHYPNNDKLLVDGKFVLTDQGHRVHHYISDITISWPVNGKFTQKQREIYSLVLKANRAVMNACKPGVNYRDMHLLAERVLLEGLLELGLVSGDIEEMMEQRLGFIF